MNVTIGAQVSASATFGGKFGAYAGAQVGPVVGVSIPLGDGGESQVIDTGGEVSLTFGGQLGDATGGIKLDLLADKPVLTGEAALRSIRKLSVGSERVERDGRNGLVKLQVNAIVGTAIIVNPAAVKDLAGQALQWVKDKLD